MSLPVLACWLLFLAYGAVLLEFKTHTGDLQFGLLLLTGPALGLSLDLHAGFPPFLACSLGLAALGTVLRQKYMPVFTYVRFLWMEPVLLCASLGLYAYAVLNMPFDWTHVLAPALPLGASGFLAVAYVQDGLRMRRRVGQGYRIAIGLPAPEFELPDQHGVLTRLSDYKGRHPVLLIFVRGDWCPGCHMMLRTYERGRERFQEKGIHVLGIGPDSIDVNKDMVERIGVGYRLLSDQGQRISTQYGVLYDNPVLEKSVDYSEGIPLPASFLVDINGIVRYVSRPDRVGEFLDPSLIFNVLAQLPAENAPVWKAA